MTIETSGFAGGRATTSLIQLVGAALLFGAAPAAHAEFVFFYDIEISGTLDPGSTEGGVGFNADFLYHETTSQAAATAIGANGMAYDYFANVPHPRARTGSASFGTQTPAFELMRITLFNDVAGTSIVPPPFPGVFDVFRVEVHSPGASYDAAGDLFNGVAFGFERLLDGTQFSDLSTIPSATFFNEVTSRFFHFERSNGVTVAQNVGQVLNFQSVSSVITLPDAVVVPVPAAFWLMMPALVSLIGLRRLPA